MFVMTMVSCASKKMSADIVTSDSVRHTRQEVAVDSLAEVAATSHNLHTVTEVEIVKETIKYDTSRQDSSGKSPVMEREVTTTRLRSTVEEKDTSTITTSETSSSVLAESTDSTSHHDAHVQEERQAQGPVVLKWVAVVIVLLVVLVLVVRWR